MTALAGNLERFVDRPIVDMTDLKGSYDFALDVTEEDYRAMLIRAGRDRGCQPASAGASDCSTARLFPLFSKPCRSWD